jgi:TolA-binding protein
LNGTFWIRRFSARRAALLGVLLLLTACPHAPAQETKENPEFKMALGLYKDGMFDLASEQFKNFIAAYPNTADGIEARYYLGLTQMKLKQYDEARITFQNFALAYVDHPKAPEAWLNVGEAFLAMGNNDEAASAYERVKVFHPKSTLVPEALLKAAEIYRRTGKKENAKQALRSIIQDYPTSKSVLAARLAIGDIYADEGQMDLAEEEARRVGEGDALPAVKAAALYSLGKLQVSESLFDDARSSFTAVVTLHGETPAATASEFELGKLDGGSGNYAGAVSHFRKVLSAKEPDDTLHARALFELGNAYASQKDYASAEKSYEQAAATPDSAFASRALLAAAGAASLNREYDKAARYAEKVLSSGSPKSRRRALVMAAISSTSLRRFSNAVTYYETYADEFPDDAWAPDVLLRLAKLSADSMSEYRKAESTLERIVEKYRRWPHLPAAITEIGKCLEKLGEYERALKTYQDLLALYPTSGDFGEIRGKIQFLQDHNIKNREAAFDDMARLMGEILTDKSPSELALKLGRIYFAELKDYKSAVTQFGAAIASGAAGEKRAEALFMKARSLDLSSEIDDSQFSAAETSYAEFLREFPASRWSDEASYRLYLLTQNHQSLQDAVPLATAFLEQYPSSPHRDRVLFDLGLAKTLRVDSTADLGPFRQLVSEFPASEYAGEALNRLGEHLERAHPDSAVLLWKQSASREPAQASTFAALMFLADHFARYKRGREAVEIWDRIISRFFYTSASAEITWSALVDHMVEAGEFEAAIAFYTSRLRRAESSPFPDLTDPSLHFRLGEAHLKNGDRQEAIKHFSEYLQMNRSGEFAGRAYYGLGILARTQGRLKAASSYFKQAAGLGGTMTASKDIADLLYQTEQYAEAAKQYGQLAQTADTARLREAYRAKVVFATLRQDKLQEADKLIEAFGKEFGDDHPYRAEFEYERGMACYRKQDYETAGKIFKRVSHDYGDTRFGPWGTYYLAKILEVTNKLDDAAKAYLDLLKNSPSSDVVPRVQLSLGNMHFNAERFEDAIRYYQKITASPESAGEILPYALNNLIDAYESTKLYDAAMKTAREFIERYPNDESILDKKIKIGSLYTKLGYYDQAILQFQNLIGEAGSLLEAELRYDIGEAYYYKGDYQQAILEFLKVPYLVSRQGKVNWTATSFYMAGQSYEKMSKFNEALGMYRQIVDRPGIDATFKGAAKKEIDRVKQLIK